MEKSGWGLLCLVTFNTNPGDAILMPSLENMQWNEKFQLRRLIPNRLSGRDKVGTSGDKKEAIQGSLVIFIMFH